MTIAFDAALREEVRSAGLKTQDSLSRLLALLRQSSDPHVRLGEAVRLAAAAGLSAAPDDIAHQLDELAALGLLRRFPSAGSEPMFDTEPEPHSHLIYEETAQTIDLHVSPETLLAIIRQTLAERPGAIEITIRVCRLPS